MPSTKKLTLYRKSQFAGPRRAQPKVRALNTAVSERILNEHDLLQRLMNDVEMRRLVAEAKGINSPFIVWHDFDHATANMTEIDPEDLPCWSELGEYLKIHILFQAVVEDGGYSFTARVRPDLEAKWSRESRDPMDRIRRLIRKGLEEQGIANLEYAYVVETRSKRGHRTPMHLHGFLATQDALVATRFKVAMERSLAVHPKGRAAAGIRPKSGPEVTIVACYDPIVADDYGRGKWASYLLKNVRKWDKRFERRIFISRTGTQLARELWALIRGEPL